MRIVNIGGPIALGVFGAILYFAVGNFFRGVDTKTIGLILLAAAVIWLVLGLVVNRPRARVTTESTDVVGTSGTAAPTVASPAQPVQNQQVVREVRQEEV